MKPARTASGGILEFIEKFEELVNNWPRDVRRPMSQIAIETKTELPHVVNYLSEVIDRTIDVHDPISYKDIDRALASLKQRLHNDLEERKRNHQKQRARALVAYHRTTEKVRDLQINRNWYSAYRTLAYFSGVQEKDLPRDVKLSMCNDLLRLGIKSDVNFQELAQWLKKGIELCLESLTHEAVEDAIDFIDAYGEHFLKFKGDKGRQLVHALLCQLNQLATDSGLVRKLKAIYTELAIPSPNFGSYYNEL